MEDIQERPSPTESLENSSALKPALSKKHPAARPLPKTIPIQIYENGLNTPKKTAIVYAGQEYTYATLINNAQQIAFGLQALGVQSGARIAVVMQPSYDLVVNLLGIHFTGATYVPIDPGFPHSRVDMILEDTVPHSIICDRDGIAELKQKINAVFSNRVHDSSSIKAAAAGDHAHDLKLPMSLDHESHIFFTSGTTGRPKGAISTHGNLAHGMQSSRHCFALEPDMGILSVAGASFSISTFELLSMLACGGLTLIAERQDIHDIAQLFELARTVSVWHFVPTLLARIIDHIESDPTRIAAVQGLRRILTGGDNVPPDLLARIRRLLPSVKLFVNYGASETSCMVTYWPVTDLAPTTTKIGFAQQNVELIALDQNREPVATGEVGELFVSSPGVIKGYLNRPELDFEKFFSREGKRFFSSGDMVRGDESGAFEMLGREDFQIQINGNRVELLEVEATIKQVEGIQNCVVAAKQLTNDSSTPTLIAYVVTSADRSPSVTKVRSYLLSILPGYMVPSMYLVLDRIPTNHNGKVDRINLPDPIACQVLHSSHHEPLASELEHKIAKVWGSLLPAQEIHARSNFFESGGDSIAAVRAMTKLSEILRQHLSITDLVKHPTVREIAVFISDNRSANQNLDHEDSTLPDGILLLKSGRQDLAPLLLINGVVEYLELASALETERPVYSAFLPEEVDLIVSGADSSAAESTNSIAGMTKLYLALIRRFRPKGPYVFAGKSYGGVIAIEVARELTKNGEVVEFIGLLDTVVPDTFKAHKKLAFRLSQHVKRTLEFGPKYLLTRFQRRLFGNQEYTSADSGIDRNSDIQKIKARHQVRREAILTTSIEQVEMPLTLIKAKDREALYGEKTTRDLGWSKYAPHLAIHEAPGDHHTMLQGNNVAYVAQILRNYI
ncbi:AMP-binding protein [Microbulbifer agarilyticus]|uniref:AMP-binding protein n=1 Tax=Microbulbifer agarilyticus TaxID=260552 RepID=UPI001C9794BE|nr:AMP-binding protein [Microbulbifer agarilyticus]MBY6190725.1 AMP-binding protein [Microbulbifer agarilyticus]